jgi:paraquat-inducible protein B
MKSANPAVVGAFVLGAIALAVGGVIFFGSARLFADTERFVIYFEGSVNGLQVGSPVKLEGVEIGQVRSVRAIADTEAFEFLTETVIEVDRSRFQRRGPLLRGTDEERTRRLIDAGIRARLELQSMITGQLFVGLLMLPDTEVRLVGGPDAPHPELPSVPTTSQQVMRTVRSAVEKFEALPLDDIVAKLDSVVAGVDHLVNESDLDEAISNFNLALIEARKAVADTRKLVQNVDGQVGPVAESAVAALGEAQTLLADAGAAVEPDSALALQLGTTLREVTEAARALRLLADYLERNPNSVVFGRGSGG